MVNFSIFSFKMKNFVKLFEIWMCEFRPLVSITISNKSLIGLFCGIFNFKSFLQGYVTNDQRWKLNQISKILDFNPWFKSEKFPIQSGLFAQWHRILMSPQEPSIFVHKKSLKMNRISKMVHFKIRRKKFIREKWKPLAS